MKKQIAFALALVASLMAACSDSDPRPITAPTVNPSPSSATVIRSVYPDTGTPGSAISIFGDNFGASSSENYVRFGSVSADVTYAGVGVLHVLVPQHLPDGDYIINLDVNGALTTAPGTFTVMNSPF